MAQSTRAREGPLQKAGSLWLDPSPCFLSWEPWPQSLEGCAGPEVSVPLGAGLYLPGTTWLHPRGPLWNPWLGPREGPSWPGPSEARVMVTTAVKWGSSVPCLGPVLCSLHEAQAFFQSWLTELPWWWGSGLLIGISWGPTSPQQRAVIEGAQALGSAAN